jgi:ATP-dependent helicase HrpA
MAGRQNLLKRIESMIPSALAIDRLAARREVRRLRHPKKRTGPKQNYEHRLERLYDRLAASAQKRNRRKENLPDLQFNEELPIFVKKAEIIQAIVDHQVIVVSGETGSGKSTQLPKFCLAAGRGIDGVIGCTQPRRIAATTVARRVSEELGQEPGKAVGYKIRFKDRTAKDTYIKFMTDGILLAETQGDRYLSAYDTIIVDEAHERSLNIDFILGILKTLLGKRSDLKLIITSATIDTEKFSKAFNDAPVIEVSGRMYPVEVEYLPADADREGNGDQTHLELAAEAVLRLLKQTAAGDILVFMPSEQDIRETCDLIEAARPAGVRVLPLFARLTANEQNRVFARLPDRKIVVATNVAETSITIPGIKYVVDSGLARISRYSPRTRTTSLPVLPVSQSSADQRKGRCGRVENGVCIRLFPEDDYLARPQFTEPEIIRANLAEVILRMIALGLGDIAEFPFIDRPDLKSIQDGFNLLFELGAIKHRLKAKGARPAAKGRGQRAERMEQASQREEPEAEAGINYSRRAVLTGKGRVMAGMPLDPRLSRMLIEAAEESCVPEIAVITAALSIQDPRERPAEKTQEADRVHKTFDDPSSDFVTLLNIWHRYHARFQEVGSSNQMKRYCRENYLSFKRMREWRDIHSQIMAVLAEQGIGNSEGGMRNAEVGSLKSGVGIPDEKYAAMHKSVLSGFLSNIAQKKEKNIFRAAKGREVMIFPGSGLFNKGKNWIVAAEVVETSRVFARTVANIDSAWLEDLGKDLCKYIYLDPHWEKDRGEVTALEQVSLFGLIIVPERKMAYGRVNAAEATDIFIQSALVNGDVKKPYAFMQHNRKLVESIRDIENRLRRRDLLVGEAELFNFYRARLPEVYDMRTLAKLLKQKGNDQFLRMKRQDLILYDPADSELARFPDQLAIAGHTFECAYAFEPGAQEDGVTVKIPSTLAAALPPETMDWLVPGLYPEKIEALIKGLPKTYRKKLVPVKDTVEIICREMPPAESSLISSLGRFIYIRFGVDIPAAAWSDQTLPDHLKMRISITAPDGREVRAGRDPAILSRAVAEPAVSVEFEGLCRKWEKFDVKHWDFGDLPDFISETGKQGTKLIGYPALEKDPAPDKRVNLRLFRQREKSLAAHPEGVETLYAIHFSKDLKFLKRQLKLPSGQSHLAGYFGGAGQFEKMLYRHLIRSIFRKNIREQTAFYAYAEAIGPEILPSGRELLAATMPLLAANHDARSRIHDLQRSLQNNSRVQTFLSEAVEDLVRLVPENFVEIYDTDRFNHLVRYVKAIMIRVQRALVDFEKDQAKVNEIRNFAAGLNRLLKELTPNASTEKRRAVEDYFWMLEEYKVSVFAQELKTAFPISAKRLLDKLKQIERMV